MDKALAEKIIQTGLDFHADFIEIFEEETRNASVLYKDKKVEAARAGTDFGIGIRLIYGNNVLYGYTSNEDEEHLLALCRGLAKNRSDIQKKPKQSVVNLQLKQVKNNNLITIDPGSIGQEKKLEFLTYADQVAREHSDKISQVTITAADVSTNISIMNSEGLWVNDKRTRSRFSINVTASYKGAIFVAREAPGAMKGFEFFSEIDIKGYSKSAAERALLMLNATYIKGKKMPVVMGNGFGGVIFHEACGHPLETEAIRRKASPFEGKLEEQIAHEKITAIDDGTLENKWGSLNIDDEGNPTQKTVLIEKGILKSYMSDRVGAKELGLPLTGSSRRESYKYSPVSRMRNTYIDNGTDTFENMIASVDYGLYAKKMGGGSVNPATGEFNFAVEEGYIIKKWQNQ